MLTDLQIKNFALIENFHIEFPAGFSVITGGTGAGKSIGDLRRELPCGRQGRRYYIYPLAVQRRSA